MDSPNDDAVSATPAVDNANTAARQLQAVRLAETEIRRRFDMGVKEWDAVGTGRARRMAILRVSVSDTAGRAVWANTRPAAMRMEVSNLSADAYMALRLRVVASPLRYTGKFTKKREFSGTLPPASVAETAKVAGEMARRGRNTSCLITSRTVGLVSP